jgi:hypothetical protein
MNRKYTRFKDIPPFTTGSYEINISWKFLEKWLLAYQEHPGIDLNPDFQRFHVWTRSQQIAYVEYCLRDGKGSRLILWNCQDWDSLSGKYPITLVDGKQRVEAVRAFLRDDIPVFGSYRSEYTDRLSITTSMVFNINALKTKAEVLQWYLEINSGGTVHTQEDLAKVRLMLQQEQA